MRVSRGLVLLMESTLIEAFFNSGIDGRLEGWAPRTGGRRRRRGKRSAQSRIPGTASKAQRRFSESPIRVLPESGSQ